jgi:hypothetical protein
MDGETFQDQAAISNQPISVYTGSTVTVVLKEDMYFKVGLKWWDLKKGTHKVPPQIKEILKARGVLQVY